MQQSSEDWGGVQILHNTRKYQPSFLVHDATIKEVNIKINNSIINNYILHLWILRFNVNNMAYGSCLIQVDCCVRVSLYSSSWNPSKLWGLIASSLLLHLLIGRLSHCQGCRLLCLFALSWLLHTFRCIDVVLLLHLVAFVDRRIVDFVTSLSLCIACLLLSFADGRLLHRQTLVTTHTQKEDLISSSHDTYGHLYTDMGTAQDMSYS